MPDVELGEVQGGSRRLRAYIAVPEGAGPWPGVVVVHEVFGLNDIVRRQADRLAAAGYLALAPDLFSDGGKKRCLVPTMRSLFSGDGPAFADIDAARRHLHAESRCTGKVGVIGFCMGGGFALLSAPRGFDAASVNYGQVPKDAEEVLAGACPVVGSYGGKDVALRGAPERLDRALTALGVEHDVKTYPTAGHSFLNDEQFGPPPLGPLYRVLHLGPDPQAAPDAWARIETFFATHLQGS